jgi:hypothetical protein
MMRALVLISLWLGALLLIPSGVHVLEMPHKLAMDRAAYFSAQQMYLGWALFGLPIVFKIILDAALAFVWRRTSCLAACGALISAALIGCGLIVFFVWVQPANVATSNWATQPPDWEALRQNWEYGHLAIAVLTALSFCGISYSAITFSPRTQKESPAGGTAGL